jgi:thioredoxin reductase (NADPH)
MARHECDLIVIGAGPAGLAAAVNAASEGLTVTVLDANDLTGGQARTSARIENYLGFRNGLTGEELAIEGTRQAKRFGARVETGAHAIDLRTLEDGRHQVTCANGDLYVCRTVLIASGVSYRKLDVPGLDGEGVHYGISPATAEDYRDQSVHVVGGANSAGQAALHLAAHGARVTILSRSALSKAMSSYLVDRIADAGITVREGARIAAGHTTDGILTHVTIADADGLWDETTAAVFVFIGAEPRTDWLRVSKDGRGFILTGADAGRALHLETSEAGVFAAGDVRSGSVKRVAAAAGEGAMAVQMIHRYLAEGAS